MKRCLSLFIEFLIYTSFSLLALSYVLYYTHVISEREKTKLDIENLVNTLNEFHGILSVYKGCGICSFTFKKKLPSNAELFFINNSDYLYVKYFSKYYYIPDYKNINISINKLGSTFNYNISKNTYRYYLNNASEFRLKEYICVRINIFIDSQISEKISVELC